MPGTGTPIRKFGTGSGASQATRSIRRRPGSLSWFTEVCQVAATARTSVHDAPPRATDGTKLPLQLRQLPDLRRQRGQLVPIEIVERDMNEIFITTKAQMLAVGAPLPGDQPHWLVVVEQPKDEAMAAATKSRRLLLAALPMNAVPVYVLLVTTVGVLHLIALNLLYPKVVGSRVHLNPLVVTFSLMLWGFLWDAPGLLLAIPLTAGIKAVCDNVRGLRPFGKFLGD